MTRRLDKKRVLITGAAHGLGKALAQRFLAEGADLILIDREMSDLETLDDFLKKGIGTSSTKENKGSITLVPLDLRKFGAFTELALSLKKRFGALDVLIGNAGILGDLAPLAHQSFDLWQEVLDVNLTANWHLLKSFDALLKSSEAGRALFVTADTAHLDKAYWGPYSVSKAALEKLIKVYAQETQKTSLKVNLVDPGDLRTALHAQAMPGLNPETITCPTNVTNLFVELASENCTASGQVFHAQQKDTVRAVG